MADFEVVDLPETDHVDVGDTAPDFTRPLVNTEFWEDASLSELTDDGPVLLVFYAMDGAFPATYMWNEMRDRQWGDRLTVVGLSISSPYEHKTLIEEREMPYSLFSDPQNGVAADYGVENDLDGMAGVSEARPAVFLLDDDRTVEYAWVASEWPDFPDYDEVESAIDDLV
ncbi:redoxin domain-containing protein [Haloprofundus salinisoli]|uniref:redoxin domain-containing protein n=1 Tax=Haloprofundus salinisoli TaxID=2876193 RepID=UPI001CC9DF61|nr:redoxin domain-containing protein [Haloprofundus salinisoli]